jgi:hypothetical protein
MADFLPASRLLPSPRAPRTRLSSEQHEPSAAFPGPVRGLLEPAPLVLASDQAHALIIAHDE